MRRRANVLLAMFLAVTLVAAGCGGDDDDDDATGSPGGDGAAATLEVTLTADSISVPEEVVGGAVEVTFDSPSDEYEVDFTRVADGTTVDQFKGAIAVVIGGGPFEDFLETNFGVAATAEGAVSEHILLEPGSYMAWAERPSEDDGDEGEGEEGEEEAPTADDILAQAFTVVEGDGDELPETDGTITATDYAFEVDAQAGDKFTFRNDGPTQFHHVVVFNFGDLDAAVVEENFPAFLQGDEEAPPPEAFAGVDFENLEAGGSGVFGPDGAGTFSMTLESGNTYAAACFISDREGGPPHAFGHDMWAVFTVD